MGEPRLELDVHRHLELFWNSLDNAPSSIVFYLEMKVKLKVGVHDISSPLVEKIHIYVKVKIIDGWDFR